MTTHLLDTDVCIDVLRGRDQRARSRLRGLGDLAVSGITVSELAYGAGHSSQPADNRTEVDLLIATVDVIDLDVDAAWHAGDIRAELAFSGAPIGGYDLLIAGTARSRDLTLVTRNLREFERVPGLRVLSW